jgi:hypothetical protein
LNAFANDSITLRVSQTIITAGDTIAVSWNRGAVSLGADFTLGLYPASVVGLENPLAITVVKGNSDAANIQVSQMPLVVSLQLPDGTEVRSLACFFYLQADEHPSCGG